MNSRRVPLLLLALVLNSACSMSKPEGILAAVPTGASPNDALIVEKEDGAILVVTASMDSAVQFFDISNDPRIPLSLSEPRVFFKPNAEGVSPNPWSVAATSDGSLAVVSLFDDHSVALIDLKTRTLIDVVEPREAGESYPVFGLPNTLTLKKPKDVLGDHNPATNISHMRAMHPTAIKVVGNQVLVAFTNLLEWADFSGAPSQYGPAVVARFVLRDRKLSWAQSLALPCKNPSDLSVSDDEKQIVVACSGNLAFDATHEMQLQGGAALIFLELLGSDAQPLSDLKLGAAIELHRFSPAKIVTYKDGLFATSSLKRQVMFVPTAAQSENDIQIISLNPSQPDEAGFLSSVVKWNDDIAIVSDFRNDQLIAIHLGERRLNPAPFSKPILLQGQEKPLVFKGTAALSRRTKAGGHSPDLYAVMALSSEVIPVNLAGVSE